MAQVLLFGILASIALPVGAAIGIWIEPSERVTAALLGFASGALIISVSRELFADAFDVNPLPASLSFLAGAAVFVTADTWLDKHSKSSTESGSRVGLVLLLAVTLDGVPENLAMGVSSISGGSVALLSSIAASNLPEAIVGSKKMADADLDNRKIMWIWTMTAILLAAAAILGYVLLRGADEGTLAVPLGFAAGAVLASLAATLMPEAYKQGGSLVAYATGAGFLMSYVLSTNG